MSKYLKYGVLSTLKLTQLHETICQLKTIKYPTGIVRELIDQLEWIEKDFPVTMRELPQYNKKNIQLDIDFI